jgi:YD repeat-containing protein
MRRTTPTRARTIRGIAVVAAEPETWQLEWDEFGPLVRHRHAFGSILAFVAKDPVGARWASCPSCRQRIPISSLGASIRLATDEGD